MNPFRAFSPGDRPTTMLMLSEDEFSETLREHGWSEHGIEVELRNLRDYKEKFKLIPPPMEETDEGLDESLAGALLRRRSRRKDAEDASEETD